MASWIAHEPFGPLIEPNPRPRYTALLGVAFVSALMGVLSLSSVEVAPPAVQGSVLSSSGPPAMAAPMLGGEVAPGVVGASSAAAEAPPEILEVRPFDRQLIGTAASPQRASSQALFRRPGASSSDLFRVGDRIDGYRVARIEPRTVTLVDPSGQQWVSRVPLYPDDAPVVEAVRPSVEAPIVDPGPDSARTAAGEASAASQTAAESPGDSTLRIRRGLFRRLVSRGLAPDSRLAARRDDAGETTGYALTVTPDSIAERLGLENGDVVVAVGGLAASEIPNVNDVLGVMRDEREVCFDIERRGVVFDLCYRPR